MGTPDCNEIVQWMVLDKPLIVQRNGLLAALRKQKDEYGDAMVDNFRPLMGNTNDVYHYMAYGGEFVVRVFVVRLGEYRGNFVNFCSDTLNLTAPHAPIDVGLPYYNLIITRMPFTSYPIHGLMVQISAHK